jgi:hypothetical protein
VAQLPSKPDRALSQYSIFAREEVTPLTRHPPSIRLDTGVQLMVGYLKDIAVRWSRC